MVDGYSVAPPNHQMELLLKENERLRREVESYSEKAARLEKVRSHITVLECSTDVVKVHSWKILNQKALTTTGEQICPSLLLDLISKHLFVLLDQ